MNNFTTVNDVTLAKNSKGERAAHHLKHEKTNQSKTINHLKIGKKKSLNEIDEEIETKQEREFDVPAVRAACLRAKPVLV